MNWRETSVLITGGTGSFGKQFVDIMAREFHPKRLIVFSRDELKQHEMRSSGLDHECLRYFIGDVRDLERLRRAMNGVDVVIHAAALKQVPACEYNPIEAVKTNVGGARNVVDAALDMGIGKVLALSTDKAVNPVNLYGATKLVAEKLFVQANSYRGTGRTRFSCVRYGNVVGSRGSVVPLFLKQSQTGALTLTDPEMTRFWITLEHGVRFVIRCVERMHGGEVFVPKIPSMRLTDLARAVAPGKKIDYIGVRPGEKIHEALVSEDDARSALEMDEMYVIKPSHPWWNDSNWTEGRRLPSGFRYVSNENSEWLTIADLRRLVYGESDVAADTRELAAVRTT